MPRINLGYRVICAVVVMLLGSVPVALGATVSQSIGAPSEQVLWSYSFPHSHTSTVVWWDTNDSWRHQDAGQVFLASSPSDVVFDKFTVEISSGGGPYGREFFVEIWEIANYGDDNGTALLSSEEGTFPDSYLGSFWTFDIEDVVLKSGNYYGFLIGFKNGPDPGNGLGVQTDYDTVYGPGYPGGYTFGRAGNPPDWHTAGYVGTDFDMEFYIQGTVIPEPLTMLAIGLGISGLGGYICKRRRC